MKQEEMINKIEEAVTPQTKDKVLNNPVLMYKATKFFKQGLCVGCRQMILRTVSRGYHFQPDKLCVECKLKFEREAKQWV